MQPDGRSPSELTGVASCMALYQVYLLRAPDGEVLRVSEVDCANDEDAVLEGTRLGDADEVEIEVWERMSVSLYLDSAANAHRLATSR